MQDYNRLNHQLKAGLSSLQKCLQNTWTKFSTFYVYVLYSTLFHLSPLRFHCVGGCWDWRTVATSALEVTRSNHSARSHPISARSHPLSARSHPLSARSHPHSARSHPHSVSLIHTRLDFIHSWLDLIHTRLDLIFFEFDIILSSRTNF